MLDSVGHKPTTRNEALGERNSSDTVSRRPTEKHYAVAELTNRLLPVDNKTPSLVAETHANETWAEQLAEKILQRIESRLPCRIRKLRVLVSESEVFLEGQCSTYYTKQIAQHTAMGVLEYERLINQIEVCPVK